MHTEQRYYCASYKDVKTSHRSTSLFLVRSYILGGLSIGNVQTIAHSTIPWNAQWPLHTGVTHSGDVTTHT